MGQAAMRFSERVVVAAWVVGWFACPAAHAGTILATIRSSGVLRIGTTGDYKPFSFHNADGTYVGADIDMAERLGQALGVRVAFVPTSWSRLNDDFKAGKFDIAVGGVTKMPARAALGDFTTTTYVDGKRPIARCADREKYTSIESIDRPDVRVVVNPGASNEDFARAKFPDAKLTVHPDNATVFEEIVAGRQDVMVTDGIEVDHQSFLHHELCPTDVPAPFTHLEKAFWVQKDPELLSEVDRWLNGEIASGSWKATLDKALSQP
jgi:cyclohexadienyl dehydratase